MVSDMIVSSKQKILVYSLDYFSNPRCLSLSYHVSVFFLNKSTHHSTSSIWQTRYFVCYKIPFNTRISLSFHLRFLVKLYMSYHYASTYFYNLFFISSPSPSPFLLSLYFFLPSLSISLSLSPPPWSSTTMLVTMVSQLI